jgi:hypothetical protein
MLFVELFDPQLLKCHPTIAEYVDLIPTIPATASEVYQRFLVAPSASLHPRDPGLGRLELLIPRRQVLFGGAFSAFMLRSHALIISAGLTLMPGMPKSMPTPRLDGLLPLYTSALCR